ncbi:MAG: 3-oxoacyl-[acyl-carrier-protein] synthase III C-terminal domain-containing protein [Terracidiphilus sp.]|jgi:3-oxoacyl-[acyl-carrier-protein] synthase-3
MNGAEIFNFTLRTIPACATALLDKAAIDMSAIDLFVFHQANKYMLDHLRKKMNIPEQKFLLALGHCGNTVSSSIPIALKTAQQDGRLKSGNVVMLVGFGVGYSWAASLLRWI